MPEVFVGAGSNVAPERHLAAGLLALAEHFGVLRLSPVYRNSPVGFEGEDFLNMVIGFETDEPVEAVAPTLSAIEAANGRTRTEAKFSPRTLDLDLLLYGDLVSRPEELQLPRDEITFATLRAEAAGGPRRRAAAPRARSAASPTCGATSTARAIRSSGGARLHRGAGAMNAPRWTTRRAGAARPGCCSPRRRRLGRLGPDHAATARSRSRTRPSTTRCSSTTSGTRSCRSRPARLRLARGAARRLVTFKPLDRFSYITTQAEEDALFGASQFVGWAFRSATADDESARHRRLRGCPRGRRRPRARQHHPRVDGVPIEEVLAAPGGFPARSARRRSATR
jgi:2-amino-4-hydroxy-6-hydroxymethyldihydropteridine diphosphokinase